MRASNVSRKAEIRVGRAIAAKARREKEQKENIERARLKKIAEVAMQKAAAADAERQRLFNEQRRQRSLGW